MPESRVVKVNADLLAFEPLPIYIGIAKSFKLGLREDTEEAGVWQKNARRATSVNSDVLNLSNFLKTLTLPNFT